jgi:hypothetical protein
MTKLFPLMHPASTQLYLWLLIATLVVHVVFMNYVLAGSLYLAFVSLFPGKNKARFNTPGPKALRDWMTFYVSAAITAGIGPLLFIQILYQKQFYTANLLLFNRWMLILPVLLVGFYLCYVIKSKRAITLPTWLVAAVTIGAALCFLFTGLSWTENYLISVAKTETWQTYYLNPPKYFSNTESLLRMGLWVIGAFPTLAVILAWQLWYYQKYDRVEIPRAQTRLLAAMAIIGLLIAGIIGFIYFQNDQYIGQVARLYLTNTTCRLYIITLIAGMILTLAAWTLQWLRWRLWAPALSLATVGTLLTISSATILREAIRSHKVQLPDFYEQHEQAAQIGGMGAFIFFLLLNSLCIFTCFLIVRQALKNKASQPPEPPKTS